MMTKLLYGLDKGGSYKVWKIWTVGEELFIEHGKEGGKQQLKREVVKGKNIGRANETTPAEQAVLEAESRYKKQIDKGYRETKEELTELPLLPMLAHDYLKQGHRIKYPCYVSAKMDGVRCLAIKHTDRVELKSRGGKEYVVPHIQEELFKVMDVGEVLDGELYIHGKYLEEIVSAVKKPNADTPNLKFIVFDVVSEESFLNRVCYVTDLQRDIRDLVSHISTIGYLWVESEAEMKEYHKKFVAQGYEGIMIRNLSGLYESGKRSADLQKFKQMFDEEFEIVGVSADRNQNAVLKVFDAVSNGTFDVCFGDFEQRKQQLAHPDSYIGKFLTVQYQTRYKDSRLPQFPVGKVIRDGEVIDGIFTPSD